MEQLVTACLELGVFDNKFIRSKTKTQNKTTTNTNTITKQKHKTKQNKTTKTKTKNVWIQLCIATPKSWQAAAAAPPTFRR